MSRKQPQRLIRFRVDLTDAKRVKEYCAARNMSEAALLRAAVQQYLGGTSPQAVLYRRLDRVSHELARLATGVELLGETFATFVQLWLAHNPEIDERDKAAAQRDVARRFRRFIEYVRRSVGDPRSTLLHRLIGGAAAIADEDELDRAALAGAGAATPGGAL